jgi:DNA-binding MarR family transcriptional regulator
MVTRNMAVAADPRRDLPEEGLETSRLVLDFLDAAYAARNQSGGSVPGRLTAHAARAAIHIYRHGQQSIGQLASGLGISYGWASRIVDELETAGYVSRTRDVQDHRVVRIGLEPAAVETVERTYRWCEDDVTDALRPLSPVERDGARAFLRAITLKLRDVPVEHSGSGRRP